MMRGYGYGYGPMMGGGGDLWFLGFLFLLFGVLVVALIVFLILWAVQTSKTRHHPVQGPNPAAMPMSAPPQAPMAPPAGAPGHDEAVAIAKKRFASGEITKAEYDEIIATLSS